MVTSAVQQELSSPTESREQASRHARKGPAGPGNGQNRCTPAAPQELPLGGAESARPALSGVYFVLAVCHLVGEET